ncbi:hypothetical protein BPNPMPFG_005424 [Mesorhizobium sp. AR07]|uniref:hypothetical protein n=1 Tax=Mesorhizobium sp. AR07 TaxID=2865838 RepID=UPI00215E189C|nr:hypothetical protein [Mesorhizobium sp. AR07]UVK43615.1 hypothetical protein BPNPMPFG_005424 [Mesorhizobium sp. AR07]
MPSIYELDLPGGMTERGFWLYVWEVKVEADEVLYVGRTGDNSSPYASSVYRRMGQHLGDADNTNALLRHLEDRFKNREIHSYERFRMFSYGPIFPEVNRTQNLPTELRHIGSWRSTFTFPIAIERQHWNASLLKNCVLPATM